MAHPHSHGLDPKSSDNVVAEEAGGDAGAGADADAEGDPIVESNGGSLGILA